jgi:hypothetical protein
MFGLVFAQESELQIYEEIRSNRTLGPHYFTPGNNIQSPFILTHMRMSLGVGGINNLRYPLITIGDQEFAFVQGDIFAGIFSIEYQHAVKDWLAVYIQYGLLGRLGSDFGTLIASGINYATTFDIGWLLRIYRHKEFLLSANFNVSNGNYTFISLAQFADDIIDGIPNASLLTANNSLFGNAGLKAAYGLNQLIGFVASLDIGYGETIQRGLDNTWFTILGVNIDFNFSHLISTPISANIGYLYNTYPQQGDQVVFGNNTFVTELSYIGRTNFILSLTFDYSREKFTASQNELWLSTTRLSMRYLF